MKHFEYFKEFSRYASLNVLGMLGLSCYILADTFFISRGLGANGLVALNLAIPIYSFINGSGLMIGMGGATRYTIRKNQQDMSAANTAFTVSTLFSLALSFLFLLIGVLFSENLVRLLGADETVFAMTNTYLKMILLFAPAFMMNNLLLCFVRNDGSPQISMAAMLGGSFSNIVLDYLFVFPLNMGILGAVLATGIAPLISMLILLPFFLKKRNCFHLIKCIPTLRELLLICSGGLPSLVTELSSGIVIIIFNAIIQKLEGNIGVAAYGIIANLSLVVLSIYTGIAQGIQPLLSASYGQNNVKKLHKLILYAMTSMLMVSALIYTGILLGADPIAAVFNSEHNDILQKAATNGLRLYFLACPFAGFNIILSVYFTSTEQGFPAHVISILRGFVILIPMAFILSYFARITGVWCTFPLTELLCSIIGGLLSFHRRNPQNDASHRSSCRQ